MKLATIAIAWALLTGMAWADPVERAGEAFERGVEKAAPAQPIVKPEKPRRILVYGRVETHQEAVRQPFSTMEVLAKKTGAFEVVLSGDPAVFDADNLKRFDAVVMNNNHEAFPMLPIDFKTLDAPAQAAAKQKEPIYQKNLLDFVKNGGGLVGWHAATAGVKWPEYNQMMGGQYAAHFGGKVHLKPERLDHPLCAGLKPEGFDLSDEVYEFRDFSRQQVTVLLSVDVATAKAVGGKGEDFPVSWIRPYGKGRVFYTSLPAHNGSSYLQPQILWHVLAGMQYATGDLKVEP